MKKKNQGENLKFEILELGLFELLFVVVVVVELQDNLVVLRNCMDIQS